MIDGILFVPEDYISFFILFVNLLSSLLYQHDIFMFCSLIFLLSCLVFYTRPCVQLYAMTLSCSITRKIGAFDHLVDFGGHSFTASEFEELPALQRSLALQHIALFTRVEPSHKRMLVEVLQNQNEVVMDMEYELRVLRTQVAEKSKHSLELQREVTFSLLRQLIQD